MSPFVFLPAAVLAGLAVGAVVGYVARGRADREEVAAAVKQVVMFNSAETRDDLAEVGPITGEQPAVEPKPWSMDGTVEPRRYPARCECGAPAIGFAESGPVCGWCAPVPQADDVPSLPRSIPGAHGRFWR